MPLQRMVITGGDARKAAILEVDGTPRLYRIKSYAFNQLSAAAVTANDDLVGFPGGVVILGAFFILRQSFNGGGSATATLSAGTVASPALYVAAQTVFAGTQPRVLVGLTQVPGTFLGTAATPVAASTVRVQLVVDVNTNLLTQGRADFYMMLAASSARP